ncbi:hypothetical protein OG271_04020 [Micromonospora rifamycinica]|uniref:hypothetical protein n=1 Tax=Micromonospora rifamycinica TaxID=291594 RepID=UPI002E2C9FA5|nr:hypothetical protein [Micromonospora rifamycinica]
MSEGVRAVIAVAVGLVVFRLMMFMGSTTSDVVVSLALGLAAAYGTWVLTRRWAKRRP